MTLEWPVATIRPALRIVMSKRPPAIAPARKRILLHVTSIVSGVGPLPTARCSGWVVYTRSPRMKWWPTGTPSSVWQSSNPAWRMVSPVRMRW